MPRMQSLSSLQPPRLAREIASFELRRCLSSVTRLDPMIAGPKRWPVIRYARVRGLSRLAAETIRRGGITKTGNARARRALVEGAWAYRMKARIGRHKVDRIEALPKVVRDIGWKAQVRLCTRYRRLSARGKTANVVNVAIAREMVGFIWSIACTVQSAPKTA